MGAKDIHTKFTGRLHDYFKAVKSGKTEKMPSEFQTHQELDCYVLASDLFKLTQHDKEYLLCLYFQFHLHGMREEQDAYEECGVDNCQMSVLEAALTDGQPIVLIGHDDY